jgi:hypothetical protein
MISVSSGIKINFLGNIPIEYVCIGKEPYTMVIVECLVLISNLIVFGVWTVTSTKVFFYSGKTYSRFGLLGNFDFETDGKFKRRSSENNIG